MNTRALLAAGIVLPYTLSLTGSGPFYKTVGVPSCVAAARDDLQKQREILARSCARDGGALSGGEVLETLVEGQHCTAVQPLTCDSPRAAERRAKRAPAVPEPETAPRA
jgi:hypothetical protein